MKFQYIKKIDARNLSAMLPALYHDIVPMDSFSGFVDLLAFPPDCKTVITSIHIKKVPEKFFMAENRLLCIGGCFTVEALELLQKNKADVYALSDFPLTDKSHQALLDMRTLGSKRFNLRFL